VPARARCRGCRGARPHACLCVRRDRGRVSLGAGGSGARCRSLPALPISAAPRAGARSGRR
jgi:hypothetical protein